MRKIEGARVLVVDDDPVLRKLFASAFVRDGYDVAVAADGEEALALIEGLGFDAVVTDLGMPKLDGLGLLRRIRERGLEAPVVLVTGAPELSSAIGAVEHGAFRYLVKPVQLDDLRAVVARAVRIARLSQLKREAQALVGAGLTASQREELGERFDASLAAIRLAFQPIVRWPDKELVAYEALLRPPLELFPHGPEELISAAERLGRVHELGRAVRHHAAERMKDQDETLFVNLHSDDLLDDELYDPRSALGRMAQRTVLEVTERAGLSSVPDARARAERLRRLGYRIAIDDLGAGYSGLSSFLQLDPQVVKLDIALVRDVHREPMKGKLVGSITQLCRELGITVLAEGIEAEEERDALEHLGCDLQQGFLYGRPEVNFASVQW